MVLRWLRRLAAAPARALTALRDGPLDMQQATEAAKCVKFGALAVVGAAAVGAGAFQLAAGPHHPATSHRGTGHAAQAPRAPVASLGAHATGAVTALGVKAGAARTVGTRRLLHAVTPSRSGDGTRGAGSRSAAPSRTPQAPDATVESSAALRVSAAGAGGEARAATGSPFGAVSAAAITRAGVPGVTHDAGQIGRTGVAAVTTTLATARHAVGTTVERAVGTVDSVASTVVTGPVAAVSTAGQTAASTATSLAAGGSTVVQSAGDAAQTVVSDGSQALGSSVSGAVSGVTQTAGSVTQAAGADTKQVVQGATGAISSLGQALSGGH
jgi:hypothetical protein